MNEKSQEKIKILSDAISGGKNLSDKPVQEAVQYLRKDEPEILNCLKRSIESGLFSEEMEPTLSDNEADMLNPLQRSMGSGLFPEEEMPTLPSEVVTEWENWAGAVKKTPVGKWFPQLLKTGLRAAAANVLVPAMAAACVLLLLKPYVIEHRNPAVQVLGSRGFDDISPAYAEGFANLLPNGWRRAGLVLGISDYQNGAAKLSRASGDATAVASLLTNYCMLPSENLLSLLDENATEIGLRAACRYLAQYDRPNDLVIMHFACHGVPDRVYGDLRLVLYDSPPDSGIRVKELLRLFKDSQASIVVVVDVCYSGCLEKTVYNQKNRWIVSSVSSNEKAFEVSNLDNAPFTHYWLRALRGEGDYNSNGVVNVSEAFEWTNSSLGVNGYIQTPQYFFGPENENTPPPLSIAPRYQDRLPIAGESEAMYGTYHLSLEVAPGAYEFILNGNNLGVIGTSLLAVPLIPGKQDVLVRRTGAAVVSPEDMRSQWQSKFLMEPGRDQRESAMILEKKQNLIPVIDGNGQGYFTDIVRNPSTEAVRTEWRGQTLQIVFEPDNYSHRLSLAFAAKGLKKIDVNTLLQPNDEEEAVLELEIRNVQGDGTILLTTDATTREIQATNNQWKVVRLPITSGNDLIRYALSLEFEGDLPAIFDLRNIAFRTVER